MKTILIKTQRFNMLITLCLSLFLMLSCESNEPDLRGSNVNFTPCRQDILRSGSSSDKVDVEFVDKGVEITYYNFEVTCDFNAVNVTHTFENGFLNITQEGYPNQANCVCYTDVSYTIEGVSRKDVNVIFINGKQVYCYNENDIAIIIKKLPKMYLAGNLTAGEQAVIQTQEELLKIFSQAEINRSLDLRLIDFATQTLLIGRNNYCASAVFNYEFSLTGENQYSFKVDISGGYAVMDYNFWYGIVVSKLPADTEVVFIVNKEYNCP